MHVTPLPTSLSAVTQKLFAAADKDGDGKVSVDELQHARNPLPSQAKGAARGHAVDRVFEKLDADKSGFITADEVTPRLSRGAFSILLAAQEHSQAGKPSGDAPAPPPELPPTLEPPAPGATEAASPPSPEAQG